MKTKVDDNFEQLNRDIGYWYYANNKVENFTKNNNEYSSKVNGFKVSVLFSNSKKEEMDDYECECSYYENVDNFCPHLYALVCAVFNLSKEYPCVNINDVHKFENQKYPEYSDEVFDDLDNYIENLPLELLEEARERQLISGEDTEILDKAISNKKIQIKKEKELNKKNIKLMKKAAIHGFIEGLLRQQIKLNHYDKDLSNYEIEEITKGNYENYQFEEEYLEEDDFYYEDDK